MISPRRLSVRSAYHRGLRQSIYHSFAVGFQSDLPWRVGVQMEWRLWGTGKTRRISDGGRD